MTQEITPHTEDSAMGIIDAICTLGKQSSKKSIQAYEKLAIELPQLEIPVKHFIHGGMYGREITIPKDSLITGQIYKFDHFDIMISGDITVSTDTGERKRFTGYNVFKGMSGKKRAGYTHEDTVWITFHPFDGESGDQIQEFITASSFEELAEFNKLVNQSDYELMVESMDITKAQIKEQVENKDDLVDMPEEFNHIFVSESVIHGSGVFSRNNIETGCVISPSRLNGLRTPAGRFTNHALHANAQMVFLESGDVDMVALRDIEANEEITVNYRDVISRRYVEGDLCQE